MRYYFHVVMLDGQLDDHEGTVFDTLDQAKDDARASLADLAAAALFRRSADLGVIGIRICSEDRELALISVDPAVEKALRATWARRR